MSLRLLIFALTLPFVKSFALQIPHTIHESRSANSIHERWILKGRVPPETVLPVRIGLMQSNLDAAHEHLMSVSDPNAKTYGRYWTGDEIVEYFKPSDLAVDAVKDWLENAGISNVTLSENKAWLAFNRPAHQVESLLRTEYYLYKDVHTGAVVASCDHYSVPVAIQEHVDYITPGLRMLAIGRRGRLRTPEHSEAIPIQRIERRTSDELANCDHAITPACIAALYSIPPSNIHPDPRNKLGIYSAQQEDWDQTDLDIFFSNFTSGRIPNGTAPIKHAIDGGQSEANQKFAHRWNELLMDLNMAYPIVYPQEIVVWDEDDNYYQEHWGQNVTGGLGEFNQLLDAIDGSYCTYSAYGETGDLPGYDPPYPDPEPAGQGGYNHSLQCGVYKPPTVLSFSYGGQEADIPIAYQRRQCNEFLKLGLQGVSLLFASGDGGVGEYPYWTTHPTHSRCLGSNNTVFNPGWPSTCPYVTNIGGSKLYPGHDVHSEQQPEAVLNTPEDFFASGGGFSNIYSVPSYQKAAVEKYLADYDPSYPYYSSLAPLAPNPAKINISSLQGNTGGLYNRIGRAYPDVAANADNCLTVAHGELEKNGGTSQSTPIFAAIVNRINEERLAAGKSTVGFLNPTLYRFPSVLNDVTNGSNAGCQTQGFQAARGWDPATGLGTPNYPKMLDLFLGLS